MTPTPPPMISFGEILKTAVNAASYGVLRGSRRNAGAAIDARRADALSGAEILAALHRPDHASGASDRRSA